MGDSKNVLIVGGGVAGLAAALSLQRLGLSSTVVEKARQLGGHAAKYACKATETCVKCGACIVVGQVQEALSQPSIDIMTASQVENVVCGKRYKVTIASTRKDTSTAFTHRSVDAVILANGFQSFDPKDKPYGYGLFANVITNLELEDMLRRQGVPRRPSDNQPPRRMAFIQCVGSRDAQLGNLWCSKVCCASALRMARLIHMRRPEAEITFFYIDVQTFGTVFQTYYEAVDAEIDMRRVIPGDVYHTGDDRLKITTYDVATQQSRDELYDMVVLSVAITPAADNRQLAEQFGASLLDNGFFDSNPIGANGSQGVFFAGTAKGPMRIAEAVVSGSQAAQHAATFLTCR